ncbi:MAG: DUF4396 domain-containing protein [Chloroflexota bacterium]
MNEKNKHLPFLSTVVAIALAAILIGGILMVPYRSLQAPHGASQARMHWNTKNSTRFAGANLEDVAARVSLAVYPATQAGNRPHVVILFTPEDWLAGLQAASLLRPLDAVLLPATSQVAETIEMLAPQGADALDGVQVLLIGDAQVGETGLTALRIDAGDIRDLRSRVGPPLRHAVLVHPQDAGSALLAAPWAAYSSDLVLVDPADAPDGIPVYVLGDVPNTENVAGVADHITGRSPADLAVRFAAYAAPQDPGFGWGFNASTTTGYRAYTLALAEQPATALLSANLARRGKPGPLLWTERDALPQVVNNYIWSQRAAFWVTPSEGPFHHFWILGDRAQISFVVQGQADYAVEIGPYLGKGVGMSGIDFLATAWVAFGLASAAWIIFHQARFLAQQNWVMRLAWPLLAMMIGPFGIPFYYLAYNRPVIRHNEMQVWDRPLWLQGLVATVSAVGFGAAIMIATGFIVTQLGAPLLPSRLPVLFLLGTPMILIMIINYVVAVLVSWLLFQTPMLASFLGLSYVETLPRSLSMVLVSMSAAALAMNPGMWWLMMSKVPMMPTEESILWFGVMFFTAFLALLMAWPFNYLLVRRQRKSGLM